LKSGLKDGWTGGSKPSNTWTKPTNSWTKPTNTWTKPTNSWTKGKGKGGKTSFGPRKIVREKEGEVLGESIGVIAKRGWKFGFIQCEEYDELIFVLGDELKEYKAGHTVKFTAYTDEQGKVSAKDLKSGLK